MTITERADRLAQLREELAKAQKAEAHYQTNAAEGYAIAAEHPPGSAHAAYTKYAYRLKGQALIWGRRVGELLVQIKDLERADAEAAPFALSAEQCAAVDDTHNFRAVAA